MPCLGRGARLGRLLRHLTVRVLTRKEKYKGKGACAHEQLPFGRYIMRTCPYLGRGLYFVLMKEYTQ